MSLLDRFMHTHIVVDEAEADLIRLGPAEKHAVEVHPPRNGEIPATLNRFVRGIREFQTSLFKIRNRSPVIAFELRRPTPDRLRLQYIVPTRRLVRKVKVHLAESVPGVSFSTGETGLPVKAEDSIGGGLLTAGRRDWYPLQTDFDNPPANAVVGPFHRHAMRDSRFVVQLLFKPVIGRPFRRWWWTFTGARRQGYLRKEKEFFWHARPATPREKGQANAIEDKIGAPRFHLSIRFVVIGADEHTKSRVKELTGGFQVFENLDTGQYLDPVTVRGWRRDTVLQFCKAVNKAVYAGWGATFQVTEGELAGLVSIPDQHMENIEFAKP